jgi:hypothetical protein
MGCSQLIFRVATTLLFATLTVWQETSSIPSEISQYKHASIPCKHCYYVHKDRFAAYSDLDYFVLCDVLLELRDSKIHGG